MNNQWNRTDLSDSALKAWQAAHPELAPKPEPEKMTAQELRAAFHLLDERLAYLIESYKSTIEKFDTLEADVTAIREGLAAAAAAPAAAPAPAGQTVQFDCNVILVGIDDNGAYTYKAKGGQYAKFGVRIWPEVLPALGLDPDKLKTGPNACNLRLVALMGDKGPRKVIGIIK
jgi:hypothetical protein